MQIFGDLSRTFRDTAQRWLVFVLPALVAGFACIGVAYAQSGEFDRVPHDEFFSENPSPSARSRRQLEHIKKDLVVVSWDLSDAVAAGVLHRAKRKKRVWRNTFVPRSKVTREGGELPARIRGADVVLLQGVQSMREVRKLFRARGWKVIVSRQYLQSQRDHRRGPLSRQQRSSFVTTAIAVRYRRGLRVTGQDHLMDLADAGEGAHRNVAPSEIGEMPVGEERSDTSIGKAQAGLAVRVFFNSDVIWFVSVAVSNACSSVSVCEARKKLDIWIEDKRDFDIPVVVGGRLTAPPLATSATAKLDTRDSPPIGNRDPRENDAHTASPRTAKEVSRGFFSFFGRKSAATIPSDAPPPKLDQATQAIEVERHSACVPHDMLFYPTPDVVVEQDKTAGCFAIVTLKQPLALHN